MERMRAESIVKTAGGKQIVDHVSFVLSEGECLALVGPSGAGKTTLLRCLIGLETPDEGRVLINGEDVTKFPPGKRGIAMIFQDAALFPHTKVKDNILYGLHSCGWSDAQKKQRLSETADRLKIAQLLERYPDSLSGGEKQRVGIARAVIRNPGIMFLDEPFSNLDIRLKETLRGELMKIAEDLSMSMISVTHDQGEAMAMGDRIGFMLDGRLAACDTAAKLYDDPDDLDTAMFFGSPEINRICEGDRIICVRPEHIHEGDIPAEVRSCRRDGYRFISELECRGQMLTMISEACPENGRQVMIGWDKEKEMVFSGENGRRIRI